MEGRYRAALNLPATAAMNRLQALLIAGLLACDGVLAQPEPTPPAALARDIVLVLDNSGSMRENDPATLIRQAVATFVERMDPDTHIGMVFFDSDAREVLPLTRLGDTTAEALNQKLDGLDYRGRRTNLAAALERAIYSLKQQGRAEASRSVVFLTDGVIDMADRAKDRDSARWLRDELPPMQRNRGSRSSASPWGIRRMCCSCTPWRRRPRGITSGRNGRKTSRRCWTRSESALLSRATPPVPKVAEEPAPVPSPPEPVEGAEPGPAEPPTAPEITAPVAPEAVPPAAPVPSFPPSVPLGPGTGPAPVGLPDRLAPWLIGFSVLLALFLAFVAARILTWVKKAAQAYEGRGARFGDARGITQGVSARPLRHHELEASPVRETLDLVGAHRHGAQGRGRRSPGGREGHGRPPTRVHRVSTTRFLDHRSRQHQRYLRQWTADPCEGASQAR